MLLHHHGPVLRPEQGRNSGSQDTGNVAGTRSQALEVRRRRRCGRRGSCLDGRDCGGNVVYHEEEFTPEASCGLEVG